MRSAVTVSLVPAAKAGPFVFSDGLSNAFAHAAELGFDALEIFPASAEVLDAGEVSALMQRHQLKIAAIGTGAGWVVGRLTLTHPDEPIRREARDFIRAIISVAAEWHAPAIIGSMQGRWEGSVSRDKALRYLAEALEDLGGHAMRQGVSLLYEPLNRYETNLFNRLGDCAAWLRTLGSKNIRILADLFHMNIEEENSAAALREAGSLIGHVHFAD